MAEVTLTSLASASIATTTKQVTFGETISEAEAVYRKASDGKYYVAHCETSQATAEVEGFATSGYSADDVGHIVTDGLANTNAGLAADTAYYLGTAGTIQLESDLASSDWITFIGMSDSTSTLDVSIKTFQRQKA